MKKVLLILLAMSFGCVAHAQDTSTVQVAVDFSYFRAQQSNFIPGFSFSGGGASAAYFFTKHIGLVVDFQDYGSHTLNFSVPAQTPPCSGLSDCPLSVSGSVFTYNAGPIFRFRVKRVEPFVETLFGAAHNNMYANIYNACYNQGGCVNLAKIPNNNAFDFILGGGIDIPFKEHIAIRPLEVDYAPTRFGNSLQAVTAGLSNTQSNLRFQAGIVFKF